MIDSKQRNALIKYRVEQAKLTISEAKVLIDNNLLRAATNRIYYGMFYMVLALGLKYEFETSKHTQLIGWFNKSFIKNKLINLKYGKMLREAFEFRQQSDYATFIEFSKEDVQSKFKDLHDFINKIEFFIENS